MQQYDPTKVSVTAQVPGSPPVLFRQWADGDMITITYNEDENSMHIGTQGEGRHIAMKNRSGQMTANLSEYSPTNDELMTLHKLNVPFVVTVVDKSSKAGVFFAKSCKVAKRPDFTRGKEQSEPDWVINFIDGEIVHSGAKD